MFKKEKSAEPKAKPAAAAAAAAVIEAMPDPLLVLSLDGEILSVNSAHLKLFGHKSPEEITGKSFEGMQNAFVNPEEDIPKMLELFGEVIEKDFIERPVELKLQRPDGTRQFIISASGAVIRDADGNPINVVAVLRDITELKRAEEERARAAAITKMVDAMVDAVVVLDLEGNAVSASRALADMFGYEPKEFIGKNIMEMPGIKQLKPEDVERFMPLLKEAIEKGRGGPVEFVLSRKDGKEIPVSLAGGVIRDAQGNPTHIVTVLRDITELKRLQEKEKEASAAKMAADTIDAMPDPLFVVNLEGVILSTNPAQTRVFGRKPEEIVGKSFDQLTDAIRPEDIEKFVNLLGRVIETGEVGYLESVILAKDGREIPTSISYSLLKDAEGNPKNIIAILKDITELKRLQEKEKAAAAENARAEVAEKFAKELQAKVRDLEDFRRVAVGRELKMKRMEEEMEELKKRKLEEEK